MLDYKQIKGWLENKENKQKVVYGICFVLVFIIGFGTGSFNKQNQVSKLQGNYTTAKLKTQDLPAKQAKGAGEEAIGQVKAAAISSDCVIKGNINAKGQKIYHIKGGAFYNLTKAEQCFATEAEAQAAGFVKSSR